MQTSAPDGDPIAPRHRALNGRASIPNSTVLEQRSDAAVAI